MTRPSSSSPSPIDSQVQPETALHAFAWQGALPPPVSLAEFDRVVPGLARRIADQAEREQLHRHEMNRLAIEAEIHDQRSGREETKRSQVLAFWLVVILIGAGATFVIAGHPGVGGTIFATTIGLVATAFLTKRNTMGKDGSDKDKED